MKNIPLQLLPGIAYLRSGQFDQSLSTLETALEIAREIRERRIEAITLQWLGITYLFLDQSQPGTEFLQQALTVAQEIGETGSAQEIQQMLSLVEKVINSQEIKEANRLYQQGNQKFQISQYREAIEFYEQSLAISLEIGDHNGQASALNNLGNPYHALGKYPQAIEF
ncbi:MAG: tetratricopeptide repeat protein, partial [Xenococcus sp. (in: cyanobacteria)]